MSVSTLSSSILTLCYRSESCEVLTIQVCATNLLECIQEILAAILVMKKPINMNVWFLNSSCYLSLSLLILNLLLLFLNFLINLFELLLLLLL